MGSTDAAGAATTAGRRDRRIAWWAVLRLDLWLEWYAVPPATGREMRAELRADLLEATDEPGGVPAAARRLSVRELAREAAVDTGAPRWSRGVSAAVVALGVVLLVQGVLSLVLADGLLSAGGGSGTLLGNEVTAQEQDGGLTVTSVLGGWPLLAAAVVFVLVARPWRLLRRRA